MAKVDEVDLRARDSDPHQYVEPGALKQGPRSIMWGDVCSSCLHWQSADRTVAFVFWLMSIKHGPKAVHREALVPRGGGVTLFCYWRQG